MQPLFFRLFGPFEVRPGDGGPLDLGPPKQRAVLALLALSAGHIVPLDRLVDELWADEAPSSATGTLQAYISHLRRALEPGRAPRTPPKVLLTREPGYLLAVPPGQVDLARFARLAEDGRRMLVRGDHRGALETLDDALGAWRGEPLAEFADYGFARPVAARLTELHASASEDRFDARLALGDAASCVADLERLVVAHPYRERLWGLLTLALYRSGRQADALGAIRRVRALLADELGLEPGPELRRIEKAVFEQSADLPGPAPETPVAVAAPALAAPRLIARGPQLARVAERVTEARRGRGGIVLVTGEAGIGKTLFARTAGEEARALGLRVVWGRCSEGDTAPAFWPWLQAVRELGDDGREAAALLSGDVAGPAADPGAALYDLHDTVFGALAAGGPTVVVLDDLHAADIASLRLLEFAAGQVHRRSVLIVATLRPEPGREPEQLSGTLARLAREPGTERLPLPPFGRADVAAFLGRDDPALAETLYQRTGGNPFYLGELLRLADSEHGLTEVPDGVREVIGRRVARLPDRTRDLLQVASALGRDVSLDVLSIAAGDSAEAVMSDLEPAVAVGLLAESDGFDYRFSHVLVCDALYAGLPRLARARLHLRVGEAMESLPGGDVTARLPVLAHHFAMAARVGGARRAVEYAARAAARACAQLAYDEAVVLYRRALAAHGAADPAKRVELLTELGRAQRATGDVAGAHATLEQAIELAEILGDRGAMAEAAMVYGGVTVWNWRFYGVVDDRMVARLEDLLAGPLEDHQRAALLGTLSLELHYGPRVLEGRPHALEAVEIARRLGDPALLAQTLNNALTAFWTEDGMTRRAAWCDEMLALPGLPKSTELVARIMRMVVTLQRGDLPAWHADLGRCRRLLGEVHRPDLAAMVWVAESTGAALAGRFEESLRYYEADTARLLGSTTMWGLDDCRVLALYVAKEAEGRVGDLADELIAMAHEPVHAPLRTVAVLAAIDAGRTEEARRLAERWSGWTPLDWSHDFITRSWGLVAARIGVPDPAAKYAELAPFAGQFVEMGSSVTCWGSMHLVLAELAAATGRPALAAEHAAAALDVHSRLGLPHLTRRSRELLDRYASTG
ncbi:AfsR/SARP family transcriptional regulator [Herbidospora sp. NBRC 101105]|uniref:AfsR/SARP family transcriptional regulator n=1 Tax=Herbidospora sp. NBRC 101105 TaxID=3032195 RepID=UPI0024A57F3B|nr:AfsR/SARP family transcriptional regulator [Herbidospora sp. NBRC 101105]GLX92273.1 ATPase AAA [Herbidospora sp. NBRC 101105]